MTTTGDEGETSDTPWGWILASAAIGAAALAGLLFWRRRSARAADWSSQLDDLSRRTLVTLDDVLARGSVVTGQVQALAAEAYALDRSAPDDSSGAESARLRVHLDELAEALEADRTLRLSTPPPTGEQTAYSTALIRQQVEQLQGVLRPPPPPPDEPPA